MLFIFICYHTTKLYRNHTVHGCKVEFMWLKERKGLFLSPSTGILYSGFLLYWILFILIILISLLLPCNDTQLACVVIIAIIILKTSRNYHHHHHTHGRLHFQKWFQWALSVHMHFLPCNSECPPFELWGSVTMAEVRLSDFQGKVMRVNAVSARFSWDITFKEVHSDPVRSSWNVKEVLSSPGWSPSWQSILYYWKYEWAILKVVNPDSWKDKLFTKCLPNLQMLFYKMNVVFSST